MSTLSNLHVIQVVSGGLPDTPFVTADDATANTEYHRLARENDLDPEDPHSEDIDVYWWEGQGVVVLDAFLADLQDEGRGRWTVAKYRYAAARFLTWAEGHGGPGTAPVEEVRAYLRQFTAPATKRFHLAVIRRLTKREDLKGLPRPRLEERPPRVISTDEEQALFWHALADRELLLLLNLLRYSGLRLGEAVGYRRRVWDAEAGRTVSELVPGLRIEDVDLGRKIATLRGKGGRYAVAYLDEQTAALLAAHIADLAHRDPAAPVFQRSDGTPRGDRWAARRFRRLTRRAGLGRRVTPHMMRHTFATRYLEAGGELRALQRLMRHRDLKSTLTYADYTDSEALRRQFDTFNKRGGPR